jgi:mRNA-degrading endonuclease toxin of MazEF toxin-antitoxin module
VSSPLQQGRIVWVELFDPQGRNPKIRPAVILTSTPEIKQDGEVVVAALSSQVDQSPPEVSVELPWHRDGHPRTKLNRRNVVVCSWLSTIPVNSIDSTNLGGIVPFAQMAKILEIVQSLRVSSAEPPPTDTKPTQ